MDVMDVLAGWALKSGERVLGFLPRVLGSHSRFYAEGLSGACSGNCSSEA
jgi:hypothetical protein